MEPHGDLCWGSAHFSVFRNNLEKELKKGVTKLADDAEVFRVINT